MQILKFFIFGMLFFANCPTFATQPEEAHLTSDRRYSTLYNQWVEAAKDLPPYSKTTPYTSLREFSNIVDCGQGIVPMLHDKIREDKGVDFVLCFAVIKIMKWPRAQFASNDITELRTQVLERLDKLEKK